MRLIDLPYETAWNVRCRRCQRVREVDRQWLARVQREAWAADADAVLRRLRCAHCHEVPRISRIIHPAAEDRLGKVKPIRE